MVHWKCFERTSIFASKPQFKSSLVVAMVFELTESEAQRYDRQIRVWGAEAQSRIQNSRVLVCGLSKMNIEVRKSERAITIIQAPYSLMRMSSFIPMNCRWLRTLYLPA